MKQYHNKENKKTSTTNIGNALYALRVGSDLSIVQASEAFKISPATYSSYEHGQTMPDVKTLLYAAPYYHINIEFLLFLLCIDVAALAQIEDTKLFRSFTYSSLFPRKFFQIHERYKKLPADYQTAINTFIEAAESCQKK